MMEIKGSMEGEAEKGTANSENPGDRTFLLITAFTSGMTIMALEMSASRLLAPYFGTSLFVWTNIIGITMISLSLGYYYGGKLVDKRPNPDLLFTVLLGTGIFSILIPFIAPVVMELSTVAIKKGNAGIFYGSLIGTVLLFAPPITALAGVAPFIVRLLGGNEKTLGFTAGRIFAYSTVGSIIGTFLPVLLMIPLLGTKKTILIFGVLLIFLGIFGLGRKKQSGLVVLLLFSALFIGPARSADGVIHEKESVHNYIQVVEREGIRYLKLNEGYAYHSIYNPNSVKVNGVWDYFNILPLLNKDAESALIIGLAAGTVAREYRHFFPHIMIDGVEIDGEIIEAGNQYFDMKGANLESHHMDGRSFLSSTRKKYDVIVIDAYKQPYIPFHLTTYEFFTEIKEHLKEGGAIGINVASLTSDSKILLMLGNTMANVYKNVYVINPHGSLNHIIIASDADVSFDLRTSNPELMKIVSEVKEVYRQVAPAEDLIVLTDDRAPVEMYTDMMIFGYILSQDTREYTQLFE
jgi:predicted membrane-bound spermidine synthase